MLRGTGWENIYLCKPDKFDISISKKLLKHISISDGKKREKLYEKVINAEEINEIESKSKKWRPLPSTSMGYYILIQENNLKEKTGYIKIAEKEKVTAIGFPRYFMANGSDWNYFKKFKKRTV